MVAIFYSSEQGVASSTCRKHPVFVLAWKSSPSGTGALPQSLAIDFAVKTLESGLLKYSSGVIARWQAEAWTWTQIWTLLLYTEFNSEHPHLLLHLNLPKLPRDQQLIGRLIEVMSFVTWSIETKSHYSVGWKNLLLLFSWCPFED